MVEQAHTAGLWPSLYEPFRNLGTRLSNWFAPASEAGSTDSAYVISLELPGVEDKDIELSVQDGIVVVKGEKKTEREEKGETWYFSERQYGSFSRSFRLPPDADGAGVTADLKDGVLRVTVPKAKPSAKVPHKVDIRRG